MWWRISKGVEPSKGLYAKMEKAEMVQARSGVMAHDELYERKESYHVEVRQRRRGDAQVRAER